MYDHLTSQLDTIRAYDAILSDLQVQQCERDRLNAYVQLQLICTNVFNPLLPCKEEVEVEPVKKPKSTFEIRVELWNAVNKEIAQVEEFLKKASTKKYRGGFFLVSCFEKNRKGFTVNADYNMELSLELQEKMIRVAEEHLEELKKQREDMENGYE